MARIRTSIGEPIVASRRRRQWARVALLVVVLTGAGCGQSGEEGPGMRIDWDLSERHTLDEVSWPKDRLDSYTTQLEPVDSVRIRLPAETVVRLPDRASDIILYRRSQGPDPLPGREGEILDKVEVYSEPLVVEAAYRLALGYAEQFPLPRGGIEAWRKRRDQGVDPVSDRTYVGLDKPLGGKSGPTVGIEFVYSANEERPWVVFVTIQWAED